MICGFLGKGNEVEKGEGLRVEHDTPLVSGAYIRDNRYLFMCA